MNLFGSTRDRADQLRLKADRILKSYRDRWMATSGVVACGIGLRNPRDPASVVIKIYVTSRRLPSLRSLPKKIEGIPLVLEESSDIRALKPGGRQP